MNKYIEELQNFLWSKRSNAWISYEHLNVYVRKAHHFWDGSRKSTLDVANINVPHPYKGRGLFTAWLTQAEIIAREEGFEAVYVESLLNPRLADFLYRRGYTLIEPSSPPCYYLMVNGINGTDTSRS